MPAPTPDNNDVAIDQLEERGFVVFGQSSAVPEECCIWAFHERLLEQLVLKTSTWRSPQGAPLDFAELKAYVGANARSQDVHWPLSLAVRHKDKNNDRKYSAKALAKRQEKKAKRGYTTWPPASWSGAGSSSGRPSGWSSGWSWGSWNWWE